MTHFDILKNTDNFQLIFWVDMHHILWICTISWRIPNTDVSFRYIWYWDYSEYHTWTFLMPGYDLIQYPEICNILLSLLMLTNTDCIHCIFVFSQHIQDVKLYWFQISFSWLRSISGSWWAFRFAENKDDFWCISDFSAHAQ
jgi:hypothetical protein